MPHPGSGGLPTAGKRKSPDLCYGDAPRDGWQVMDALMDLKMDPAYPMQAYTEHFTHLIGHPHLPAIPSGFKLHLFLRGLTRSRRASAEYHLQTHPKAMWVDVANNLRELECAEAMIHRVIKGDGRPLARSGRLLSPFRRAEPPRRAPESMAPPLAVLSSSPSPCESLPAGFSPAKPDLANLMRAGLNESERDAVAGIISLSSRM